MKHLIEHWEEVKKILTTSLFVMADYDGTLTPIVDRPEEAILSEEMKEILSCLAENCPVGIISGRPLEEIKKKIGIQGIHYAGNHGLEISGPSTEYIPKEARSTRPVITDLCSVLEEKLKSIDGVLVEDKGLTASVHYRLVKDPDVSLVKEIFDEVTRTSRKEGLIKVTNGKKVLEIRPNLEWNKESAVRMLLEVNGQGEILPIYLGDDLTDEPAFRVSKEEGGFGVLVSDQEKNSEADYRLEDVHEVKIFLLRLIDFIGRESNKSNS